MRTTLIKTSCFALMCAALGCQSAEDKTAPASDAGADLSTPRDDQGAPDLAQDLATADLAPDAEDLPSSMSTCEALTCPTGQTCRQHQGQAYCGFKTPEPCSASTPCQRKSGEQIAASSVRPSCITPAASKHDPVDDSPPQERVDAQGVTRFGCLYEPAPQTALPLVIFLHGGSGNADNVYGATTLRQKAAAYDLTGDPDRAGFVLLSLQARNLHYPYGELDSGIHFDSITWDLDANLDVANLEAWIDDLVTRGVADPQRVYLIGWSEGGLLAQLYTLLGGDKVAATAIYSASSPFDRAFDKSARLSLPTLPTTTAPTYVISRTCDLIACDEAQREALNQAEGQFADTLSMSEWQRHQRESIQNAEFEWRRIDDRGVERGTCALTCAFTRGLINHSTWPDAVNGDEDQEVGMLEFLKRHTRAAR